MISITRAIEKSLKPLAARALLTYERLRISPAGYCHRPNAGGPHRGPGPVQSVVKNKRIRAGQPVISLIGAANRDPAVFSDPNTLDIGRKQTSHLSFGRGIHYCLGASLAVMEAKVAFAALLKRYPSIRLSAEPVRRHQITLRGLNELWVEVERS